jgi:hypothetical protein
MAAPCPGATQVYGCRRRLCHPEIPTIAQPNTTGEILPRVPKRGFGLGGVSFGFGTSPYQTGEIRLASVPADQDLWGARSGTTEQRLALRMILPTCRSDPESMRQVYAHDALVRMRSTERADASGAAITVALCGAWRHKPACPLTAES